MKEKDDIQTHYERQIEKLKLEKVKDVEFETHELKEKEKELQDKNKKLVNEAEDVRAVILSSGEPID